MAKLAGANILILAGTGAAFMAAHSGSLPPADATVIAVVALAGSFLVNAGLIVLALRPIHALERFAAQVSGGEYESRVQTSVLADARVAHLGETLNALLDGLVEDRARARRLVTEVIGAGDRERAYIARELHDSVAQTLVALKMQLSVAIRDCTDPEFVAKLENIRAIGIDAFDEVRRLAHTMHPRVLDDLGLVAALEHLARQSSQGTAVSITVGAPSQLPEIGPAYSSVLYRVAQEAISNALRYAEAHRIHIDVTVDAANVIVLDIHDNGRGFDVAEAEQRRPGMGLFTMRERVAIVNGDFTITSHPGEGTHVSVRIPLRSTPSRSLS